MLLARRWRLEGGERGSRFFLQAVFDARCNRVRAAKHAPRDGFYLLKHCHGFAEIVERGAGVIGNGTAATRSRARHPEGTLFLGFLLALLVLVVVLAAPCQRRALGDAVPLPDEEDL